MGHVIIHRHSSIDLDISDKELVEFVSIFLDVELRDDLHIRIEDDEGKSSRVRGRALSTIDGHTVYLFLRPIGLSCSEGTPAGGNFTVPADLREGAFLVLAHELRHVWQFIGQLKNKAYWKGKYKRRPCEIDARQYVDKMEEEILCFAGSISAFNSTKRRALVDVATEVRTVVEFLFEGGDVSDDDLQTELCASGLNNPMCLSLARDILQELSDGAALAA